MWDTKWTFSPFFRYIKNCLYRSILQNCRPKLSIAFSCEDARHKLPEVEPLLSLMLRLSKRKAGNVWEGAREHTCKVLFIFLLWYKSLLYIGHFSQSLTNISCLSPISFLSDLFIPNKKKIKPQRIVVILFLFVSFMQAVLYRWLKLLFILILKNLLHSRLPKEHGLIATVLQIYCCG